MLEEVLDLLERDVGQIGVAQHFLVAPSQSGNGHGNDFLVSARLILHSQHAYRTYRNDCAWHDPALIGNEHIAGVSVVGQRVRNEAVISRVAHRSIEKPIDDQRSGGLVHFVLDWFAADWDFNHHVDFFGRIPTDRDCVQAHDAFLEKFESCPTAQRLRCACTSER